MWNNGYRAKRIEDMIQDFAARGVKLSMREQQLIQTDVFTIPGKEFVEKFLKFLGTYSTRSDNALKRAYV